MTPGLCRQGRTLLYFKTAVIQHRSSMRALSNTRRWETQWKAKVLLFDKSLNNGLLLYYLNIFRFWMAVYKLRFDTSTTQIHQKLLEIHQLKDKFSFPWYAEFEKFGMINFANKSKQIVADGHLWALRSFCLNLISFPGRRRMRRLLTNFRSQLFIGFLFCFD